MYIFAMSAKMIKEEEAETMWTPNRTEEDGETLPKKNKRYRNQELKQRFGKCLSSKVRIKLLVSVYLCNNEQI